MRKLFVLLCLSLVLASLVEADSRRRRREYSDSIDDEDDRELADERY